MSSKRDRELQQFPMRDRIATIHEEESTATVLLHAAREKLPTILEDESAPVGGAAGGSKGREDDCFVFFFWFCVMLVWC